ncbi:LptF/LptG family permease [Riemerella columbipharyngis]|uniref:Lipopolysaccharide export system permease protein n=1 Tax=Riemerella columbipharyngis TaxID=1071918 RepID=A0A1G6YE98_9FLAO|nr:LptF/LptG family permease [Riemerella columbipharyngis]SDD88333.1 lipopolysaccharide export system permease protein [Riemerella columbipharyngis]
MLKKLDKYIIKTFFGPFLFIFSVLCFIFIVNIVWIKLSDFTGKGLTPFEISKLLFYLGVSIIQMVMPLTILLSSIMTFGDFGEHYELAAIKSAGISLFRVMRPLLMVVGIIAGILFLFSNNIIPSFNKKAKNMLYNIAIARPALSFTAGQFVTSLPGTSVKFDKIEGENGQNLTGVFIHKTANLYEDQQTIVAKRGRFANAEDPNYLKLVLYNGYIFEDNIDGSDFSRRVKQPNQSVKFDSLVSNFDISELRNQAIEKEKVTDNYDFHNYSEVSNDIKKVKNDNKSGFETISYDILSQISPYLTSDGVKDKTKLPPLPFKLDTLDSKKRLRILENAYDKITTLKDNSKNYKNEIYNMIKHQSTVIKYQQKMLSYSFACLIFFIIGASLGSIIRKGGMGFPVVVAIMIYIVFYVIDLTAENLSWKSRLNPYLAVWLPNIVLFPLSIWLVFKALTDSQVFDAEKYKMFFKPIIKPFIKKEEHKRYQ